MVNFWLVYQVDFSDTLRIMILLIPIAITSLVFVYRMIQLNKPWNKLALAFLVVGILMTVNILGRNSIAAAINAITSDIETGYTIYYFSFAFENILVATGINRISKHKSNSVTNR